MIVESKLNKCECDQTPCICDKLDAAKGEILKAFQTTKSSPTTVNDYAKEESIRDTGGVPPDTGRP